MISSKPKLIIGLIGAFFISTGISYGIFRTASGGSAKLASPLTGAKLETKRQKVDTSAPKTAECPLNGAKFTEAEKTIWGTRRPLGIMIENHLDSRPQSGLSRADVVYEAVAEGGITRFLAVFYCGASSEEIVVGPVRSIRTYFLDWISEYGDYPLLSHIGGANCNRETGSGCAGGAKADALGQIDAYGWYLYNDLSGFSIGLPTYWRDTERLGRTVAWEHTAYSSSDKLWEYAAKRKLTSTDEKGNHWDKNFVKWLFKDDATESDRGSKNVTVNFWEGYTDYTVKWNYDLSTNTYKRSAIGAPHIDMNNKEQLSAKNLVVMFAKESRANDGYDNNAHLLYVNKGSGKALVFQDGNVTEGTWNKKDRLARTKFLDNKSKEIKFNRGAIWIEVVPVGATIEF